MVECAPASGHATTDHARKSRVLTGSHGSRWRHERNEKKSHPVSKLRYLSRQAETPTNWPDSDETLIFHPLCTEVLKTKLRASLEQLAIERGKALASTKDTIRRVARDSNQLAPELAKEILAALHHALSVLEAIGTVPRSTAEEDLDKLRETARLLHKIERRVRS